MSLLQRLGYYLQKIFLDLTARFFGYFYFEALRIRGQLVTEQLRRETQQLQQLEQTIQDME